MQDQPLFVAIDVNKGLMDALMLQIDYLMKEAFNLIFAPGFFLQK